MMAGGTSKGEKKKRLLTEAGKKQLRIGAGGFDTFDQNLHCLTRRELAEHYDEIVEFAAIPDLPDTPLKYYSSGMEARLAFSVAVCLQPDILLLDEVLAVGDQAFRERCLQRLRQHHARGGTLVLVSHELEQLRELCTRAVWLDQGRILMDGPIDMVLERYRGQQ